MGDNSLDSILRLFDPFVEAYELLETAISLPLDLINLMPSIVGSAIIIVVVSMVIKFIIGR